MKTFAQKLLRPLRHPVPAIGLLLGILLTACSTYKDMAEVKQQMQLPELPQEFASNSNWQPLEPVAQWWTQLQDPVLSELVETALAHNHDLRIASASIAESRALLSARALDWLPTVRAGAEASREKTPQEFLAADASAISETYSTGFDASWELDLFGRIHQQVSHAQANVLQREAALYAAQVSIAAETAATYIELRGAQYQKQVAEHNIAIARETLNLIERFAEVGRASELDRSRSQAQWELSRAQLPQLQANIEVAINRLAVLANQAQPELSQLLADPEPLPSLPVAIAVGNTTSLLQRRPDIRQAEMGLQASIAAYNVRVADLYPRITFSGGLGYLASDWDSLGKESSETFRFAPNLSWAAFDLGRVRARIRAADAVTDQNLAMFEKTVLNALEETQSALAQFNHEEQRRQFLQQAAIASTRAAEYARHTFELGSSDFLSVLDAQRQELINSAQLARSETQLLLHAIAVYKALGGGWQALPSHNQIGFNF